MAVLRSTFRPQIRKLEEVEKIKEKRLDEAGFKRPWFGGHEAPIFLKKTGKGQYMGAPLDPKFEIGEKVNVSL